MSSVRGQIIGSSDTRTRKQQPFVWQAGTMTKLPTRAHKFTTILGPTAINDRGQIISDVEFSYEIKGGFHIEDWAVLRTTR